MIISMEEVMILMNMDTILIELFFITTTFASDDHSQESYDPGTYFFQGFHLIYSDDFLL